MNVSDVGLLGQFREPHPWWDEYAEEQSERGRRAALMADLERRAEERAAARERAIERIGWTGGEDC